MSISRLRSIVGALKYLTRCKTLKTNVKLPAQFDIILKIISKQSKISDIFGSSNE